MTRRSIGRPRFVTIDEALAYQELAIARFGGAPGLRDRGLLEESVGEPREPPHDLWAGTSCPREHEMSPGARDLADRIREQHGLGGRDQRDPRSVLCQ